MRVVGAQYTHELAADLGIKGRSVSDISRLFAELLRCSGIISELAATGAKSSEIRIPVMKPFMTPPEELRRALFEFQVMATRVLNGHVRASRERREAGEIWRFEDTGRWLW